MPSFATEAFLAARDRAWVAVRNSRTLLDGRRATFNEGFAAGHHATAELREALESLRDGASESLNDPEGNGTLWAQAVYDKCNGALDPTDPAPFTTEGKPDLLHAQLVADPDGKLTYDHLQPRPTTEGVGGEREADPMPVFTIKAKDNLALDTVAAYRRLCNEHGLTEQGAEVAKAIDEISGWRARHPDRWKMPDHKHLLAAVKPLDSDAIALWRPSPQHPWREWESDKSDEVEGEMRDFAPLDLVLRATEGAREGERIWPELISLERPFGELQVAVEADGSVELDWAQPTDESRAYPLRLELTPDEMRQILAARAPEQLPDTETHERWELIERFAKALANPECDADCEGTGIDLEGSEWTLCDGPSCTLVTLRAREASQ